MGYEVLGELFYIGYRQEKKRVVYFGNEEVIGKVFSFVWEEKQECVGGETVEGDG